MSSKTSNRREFLQGSIATGAALGTLASLTTPAYSRVLGANDRIRIGSIGTGGRGRWHIGWLHRTASEENLEIMAVCDVWDVNRALGESEVKNRFNNDPKLFKDYRKLLEDADIDAVVIATPDHQHSPMLADAVQAGKDVYCEKPMSHSIEEGAWTVQEVRKTDRIVQIGMQRRSAPLVHEGLKVMQSGILGDVTFVKAQWNWHSSGPQDNSPLKDEVDWARFQWPHTDVEFQPKYVRNWRVFWPFSGGISNDQGTHIMDVVQLYMGQVTPLEGDGFGYIKRYEGADAPDVFSTTLQYKDFVATWTINYTSRDRKSVV